MVSVLLVASQQSARSVQNQWFVVVVTMWTGGSRLRPTGVAPAVAAVGLVKVQRLYGHVWGGCVDKPLHACSLSIQIYPYYPAALIQFCARISAWIIHLPCSLSPKRPKKSTG
jgi:hypothetical protein